MKRKLSKIIFIFIFVAIALLTICNTVRATVTLEGTNGGEFYTADDIHWGGFILIGATKQDGKWVGGQRYYCKNHKWALGNGLGSAAALKIETDTGTTYATSEENALRNLKFKEEYELKGTAWEGGKVYKGLKLNFGPWKNVRNAEGVGNVDIAEALYAFADKYYDAYKNPSYFVQKALWKYINEYENPKCPHEGNTSLNDAAKYYVDEWIPNNKADLKGDKSKAKVRIKEKDYIVGPFTITYNEAKFGKIDFSWLSKDECTITDQTKVNKIPSAQVTDKEGTTVYEEIPNGKDFYIKFPYSDSITELNLKVSIEYIDSVSAEVQDVKTTAYDLEFVWYEENIEETPAFQHAPPGMCVSHPGVFEVNADSCPHCEGKGGKAIKAYRGKAKGRVEATKKSSDPYQNMRLFRGDVQYKKDSILLSIPIIPPGPTDNPPDNPPPPPPPAEEMDLAGDVWLDGTTGKDQSFDGMKGDGDSPFAGIEVRLYDLNTKKLAKVYTSTNPTFTDANGHYEFKGLNATHKYYVEFRYDGILYTNTYGAGGGEIKKYYNTDYWNKTSKGSEIVNERNYFNERFRTINSYPMSYKVPEKIFDGEYLNNGYNKIFSLAKDLKSEDGGGIVQRYKKAVSAALASYLQTHMRIEDDNAYKKEIYGAVINAASDKTEAKQVLQYIWDSTIKAYAGYDSEQDGKTSLAGGQYYPVYDKFALTDEKGNRITANNPSAQYNGYPIIYNGQLHVNLGLIERPTTQLELTEDLYQAVVSINGQDETYKFNTFSKKGVKLAASDIGTRATSSIEQQVATADYNYANYKLGGDNPKIGDKQAGDINGDGIAEYPENYAPIEMYITYRINVKNNSAMPTSVNEIVSYIDSNYYSYSNEYLTTGNMKIPGVQGSHVIPNGEEAIEKPLSEKDPNKNASFGLQVYENSQYVPGSETGRGNIIAGLVENTNQIDGARKANDLYITLNDEFILQNNEMLSIYITYRLGENSTTHAKFNCTYKNESRPEDKNHAYLILQDNLDKKDKNKKVTIYTRSEINAYSTYYRKSDDAGTTQGKYPYSYHSPIQSGEYRAAGVFDSISMPGNLDSNQVYDFECASEPSKLEEDWDRASAFVLVDPSDKRIIQGNAWETVGQSANYWLENKDNPERAYPKYEGKYGAKGITAELVELKARKATDGKVNVVEYVRARTKTNNDGEYAFEEYIPGQYVVRFIYGDTAKYNESNPKESEQHSSYTTFPLNGVDYYCAYNGQFYQSGRANPKTNDNQYWYSGQENENVRYSDAYDEATRRIEVNNLLNTPLENNSTPSENESTPPKSSYKYSDVLHTLKHPTEYMVYAYTSLLDIEVEYAKTESVSQNPAYTIENIDFALTPRAKSELTINKEVTRLKLVLQNGTVQFDASTEEIRNQAVPAVVQAAQGNDINISMSSELVNGATLEITYKITVTNTGEKDTITYYTDKQVSPDNVEELQKNAIALGFYEEDPTKIVYYEGKMRKHNIADDAFTHINTYTDAGTPWYWTDKVVSGLTETKDYTISKNNRATIETTTRAETVADFVSTNLTFAKQSYTGAVINENWDLVTKSKEDFEKMYYKQYDDDKVYAPKVVDAKEEDQALLQREMDPSEVYDCNTIVISSSKNPLVTTDLKPGESVSEDIVLSKVISVNDNSDDKKSYMNRAKIIDINNKVSRIQDMAATGLIHKTERVIVSDPTGIGNAYLGIVLTLVVTVIIGAGIFLIKKFVLNRK